MTELERCRSPRRDAALGGLVDIALARLALDGINRTASLLRQYRVPHHVITRVLRYPAFRRGATPGL